MLNCSRLNDLDREAQEPKIALLADMPVSAAHLAVEEVRNADPAVHNTVDRR